MTAVALVCLVLATARITRLVTTDEITEPWRARLARRNGLEPEAPPRLLTKFVHCSWCVSVWVAAAAAVVARYTHLVPNWQWAGWAWLAAAGGSGLLLGWE